MIAKKGTRKGWVVVGARIPPDLHQWVKDKYPNDGDISNVIFLLLKKLKEGKIFGINVNTV